MILGAESNDGDSFMYNLNKFVFRICFYGVMYPCQKH